MSRRTPELTSTSYALLGLLSVQPWTTYELAQQMHRSLHWIWPRAERKLYDEPKRLVAAGYAKAREEHTGRRKRTVYTITPAGRRALAAWLGQESAPPVTENEAVVRVFFADSGDLDDLRATLAATEAGARARLAELNAISTGEYPFPERSHISAITMRLAMEQEVTLARWAKWANAEVAQWRASDDPGDWDVEARLAELTKIDV